MFGKNSRGKKNLLSILNKNLQVQNENKMQGVKGFFNLSYHLHILLYI